MARRNQGGWKIRARGAAGVFYVRFRHAGARVEESTGTSDEGEAARRAAEIYAHHITRKRRVGSISPRLPLVDLASTWLVDLEGLHAPRTIGLYASHMKAHLLPHFKTLDRVTTAMISDYIRDRLREVLKGTVRAELNTLRSFLNWLKAHDSIDGLPEWPKIPRRAIGKRNMNRRKGATEVTPEDVARWLSFLPEMSKGKKGRHAAFPVRARFEFAWETGLRPSTYEKLTVPEHWEPGSQRLTITDEVDKARYGRTVPLTPRAVAILTAVAPPAGLIFGVRDCKAYVYAATEAADMPRGFSPYDLRHGRATHLTETSGNIPGVAFLLGHKKVTTTAIYVKPTRRAAESVLASATPSGGKLGAPGEATNENSGETRANASQPFSAWERSARKNPRNLGGSADDSPLADAENRGLQDEPGAVPPTPEAEIRGLRKGRVWLDAWDLLEEFARAAVGEA